MDSRFAKVRGELEAELEGQDWIAVGSFLAMMSELEEFATQTQASPVCF